MNNIVLHVLLFLEHNLNVAFEFKIPKLNYLIILILLLKFYKNFL